MEVERANWPKMPEGDEPEPEHMPVGVCVSGSRHWPEHGPAAREITDRLAVLEHKLVVVIEGGARGADRVAGRWAAAARARGVGWVRFPAEWDKYGARAGPRRNQEMVDWLVAGREAGVFRPWVLAFPAEESRGTWDLIGRARTAGIRGLVVRRPSPGSRS